MTYDEAMDALMRVFTVYPSYMQWVQDQAKEMTQATLKGWAMMLIDCDARAVDSVVRSMETGDLEPTDRFQKPDALPRNIRSEARRRAGILRERKYQVENYHRAMQSARNEDERFGPASSIAVALGEMVRDKQMPVQLSRQRMDELMIWYRKGGPIPEWCRDMFGTGRVRQDTQSRRLELIRQAESLLVEETTMAQGALA